MAVWRLNTGERSPDALCRTAATREGPRDAYSCHIESVAIYHFIKMVQSGVRSGAGVHQRSSFHPLRPVSDVNARHGQQTQCNAIAFPYESRGKNSKPDQLPSVAVSPKQDDHDLLTFLRNRIPSPEANTGWGHFFSGTTVPHTGEDQPARLLFLGLYLASLSAAALADVHKAGNYVGSVALSSFHLNPCTAAAGDCAVATVSLKGTPQAPAASAEAWEVTVAKQYDTVQLTGVVASLLVAATALNGEYAHAFAQQPAEAAAAAMPRELLAIGVSSSASEALRRAAAPTAGMCAPGAAHLARTLALEAVRVLAVGPHRASEEELRAVRVLCQRVNIRDMSAIAAGDAEDTDTAD